MVELTGALVSGLFTAVPIFLVAAGLTIVYGTLRVLNFAHGAVFMIGAYVVFGLTGGRAVGVWSYVLAVAVSTVVCAALSVAMEVGVFRRLYRSPHEIGLLASFALLFVLQGIAQRVWGLGSRAQGVPVELAGAWRAGGLVIGRFTAVTAALCGIVGVVTWLLLTRSRMGNRLRAVADDRDMAAALGLSVNRTSMVAFALSGALAGFAGALLAPQGSIDVSLAERYLVLSFAVVILGGLGSVGGALVGALLLGIFASLSSSYAPLLLGFEAYVVLIVGLLVRRQQVAT